MAGPLRHPAGLMATVSQSAAPLRPDQPALGPHFACVTMNMSDRLRFINFPPTDFETFRNKIASSWPMGIQQVRTYGKSMEIQLRGFPWNTHGSDKPRRLLRSLLECMFNRGWVLQAAMDVQNTTTKDSLFFRHQFPPPAPREWLVVAFDRYDRLTFVDAPGPDLAAALIHTYGRMVGRHEITRSHFMIKFHGYPWMPSRKNTVTTRVMVLKLLEVLETFGFTLYANINQQNDSDGYTADVLYVHRPRSWVPHEQISRA